MLPGGVPCDDIADAKPDTKIDAAADSEPNAKPDTLTDATSDGRTDNRPYARPDAKDAKRDAQFDTEPDTCSATDDAGINTVTDAVFNAKRSVTSINVCNIDAIGADAINAFSTFSAFSATVAVGRFDANNDVTVDIAADIHSARGVYGAAVTVVCSDRHGNASVRNRRCLVNASARGSSVSVKCRRYAEWHGHDWVVNVGARGAARQCPADRNRRWRWWRFVSGCLHGAGALARTSSSTRYWRQCRGFYAAHHEQRHLCITDHRAERRV